MMRITVLGSTGSIGLSTLDVVARHPDRYSVHALTAHRNVDRLFEQCLACRPAFAAMADADAAGMLAERVAAAGLPTVVLAGGAALAELAADPAVDCVVAGIVGAAGLLPTWAAARAGKRILLANKEVLVMSGALFMDCVRRHGATLLPVDSEHNAIFQCLPPSRATQGIAGTGVERILLTASGGPFRNAPLESLESVTPEQACAHPNWVMGRKISVDSATMMNKGLELIEACLLFDAPPEQVEVVIHPQSIVHSLVAYQDGSVLAQLGNPDMRTPIAHALAWPERIDSGVAPLDLFAVARLDFQAPEPARFPCLGLAYQALRAGGSACAVLNAANEVAVAAFLDGRLGFTRIAAVVAEALERVAPVSVATLDEVLEADRQGRAAAEQAIQHGNR